MDGAGVLGRDGEAAVAPAEQVRVEGREEDGRQRGLRRRGAGEGDQPVARVLDLVRDRREPGAGVAQSASPDHAARSRRVRRAVAAQVAAGERGERRVAVAGLGRVAAPVAAVEPEDELAPRRADREQVRRPLAVGADAGRLERRDDARAVQRPVLERAQQHRVGGRLDAELRAPPHRRPLGEVTGEAEEPAAVAPRRRGGACRAGAT